jgi:hypothetical protein
MRCDGQRGPKVYFHCLHFQEGARLAERTEMDQVVSVSLYLVAFAASLG